MDQKRTETHKVAKVLKSKMVTATITQNKAIDSRRKNTVSVRPSRSLFSVKSIRRSVVIDHDINMEVES